MANIQDSDIQRLVACLVLGYLENQSLDKTYSSFCESSRHLTKEKKGLRDGNKPLDTSFGLVNIIREYFSFKAIFTEFLRVSPKSPIIVQLIETDDTISRLSTILKTFRENLHKFDKVPTENLKKRRHSNSVDDFDVSNTNTSTPETQNVVKKRRRSLATPFLTVSGSKEVKTKSVDKSNANRVELGYKSSTETSNKEDDDDDDEEEDGEEDEENASSNRNTASPASQVLRPQNDVLSKTLLEIPELPEQIADLINKTRSNELDAMTGEELDKILTDTRNDPMFDDMIRDLVDKFHNPSQESTSSSSEKQEQRPEQDFAGNIVEEVPIKQRLRHRVESKPSPVPVEKKKEKITILSNDLISAATTLIPPYHEIPQVVMTVPQVFMHNGLEMIQIVQNVPPMMNQAPTLLPNMQSFMAPGTSSATHQNVMQSIVQPPPAVPVIPAVNLLMNGNAGSIIEKKQTTPKVVLHPSFVKTASRSTPRHVRTLDFNQTPSHRLSTLAECKTPLSRIPDKTPGSAPAMMGTAPTKVLPTTAIETIPEIDDSSNSNSIVNTPKVVKNRRRRKIANFKSEPKSEEKKLEQPSVEVANASDEWARVRSQAQMPVDELMRREYEKAEMQSSPKTRRRTPVTTRKNQKKVLASKNKSSSHSPEDDAKTKEENSTEYDENKPLSSMKSSSARKCPIKILSPRKAMKNSPKKKKKQPTGKGKGAKKQIVKESAGSSEVVNESNRSDTVQEVATALLDLSSGVKENGADKTTTPPESNFVQNQLMETPFKGLLETPLKTDSLTPLPNTPQFAVPIMSHTQETPAPKIFGSSFEAITFTSIIKNCDIPTPSFPITPGAKNTPFKEGAEGSPNSGYCSRRTDYSSSSSYYKPDECEININAILNQRKSERQSQSESDGGASDQKRSQVPGSVKKVECPGAIERVKSFTEEQSTVPTPHYKMMEDGLLNESMVQTATDDSNNSSSTCTTCSTCSSTCSSSSNDQALNKKLDEASGNEDKDSEWEPETVEERALKVSPAVNQRTGEVRFPLRNWMTPKKSDVDERQAHVDETNRIRSLLSVREPPRMPTIEEEHQRIMAEMEATKKRTLEKLRRDSNASSQPKFKRTNVKNFKLPAESLSKPSAFSRKDQILSQQLTERPRPTPLKLIPSSSSRRKNATPRKTIVIDELPRQPSPIKKKKAKPEVAPKSPEKTNRLSLESLTDNAVTLEDPVGHNLSSSFTSNDEETANTVVENTVASQSIVDEESNTFQKTLIAQGFNKNEALVLQQELVDKLEESTSQVSVEPELPPEPITVEAPPLPPDDPVDEKPAPPPEDEATDRRDVVAKDLEMTNESVDTSDESSSNSSDSDSEDEELEVFSAAEHEKNVRNFIEPPNFQPSIRSLLQTHDIPKSIMKIDGRCVTLQDTGLFDIFQIEPKITVKPTRSKKQSPKKSVDGKKNGKEVPPKNGKPKTPKESTKTVATTSVKPKAPKATFTTKPRTQKTPAPIKPFDINDILTSIHGK